MRLDAAQRQVMVRSAAWAIAGRPGGGSGSGSLRLTLRLVDDDWQAWAALLRHATLAG